MKNIGIHIFRRDLRLDDNTALIKALSECKKVIPCFILDPEQADRKNNRFFSENAFSFMMSALGNLDSELRKKGSRLYLFKGNPDKITRNLLDSAKADAVYTNRDYTPFSRMRDENLKNACIEKNAEFIQCNDLLLSEPEDVLKPDKSPYTLFTPFWKNASKKMPAKPCKNIRKNYFSRKINGSSLIRNSKAKIIIPNHPKNYEKARDTLSMKTSGLSKHLKFGTVSVRRAFYETAESKELKRQLYWRDFFTHIAFHFPEVLEGKPFRKKFKDIKWRRNIKLLNLWKSGRTGFPIVDAAMRQLNKTGEMHGRARMIAASFLVKDLHIDWRDGEKYFAEKLTDYDPSLNNGNWQWIAGTGADAMPYFRIFNPELQQAKHDNNAEYIRKWIPELRKYSSEQIKKGEYDYIIPILIHKKEAEKSKALYRDASNS